MSSEAKNSISKTLPFKESNKSPIKTVSCESMPMISIGLETKAFILGRFSTNWACEIWDHCWYRRTGVVWECRICEKTIYVKPRTKEAGRQGLVQHVEYNHGLGMFKAEQSRSEVNAKEKIKQTREFTFTLLESGLAYTQFLENKYRLHSYLSRHGVLLPCEWQDLQKIWL